MQQNSPSTAGSENPRTKLNSALSEHFSGTLPPKSVAPLTDVEPPNSSILAAIISSNVTLVELEELLGMTFHVDERNPWNMYEALKTALIQFANRQEDYQAIGRAAAMLTGV